MRTRHHTNAGRHEPFDLQVRLLGLAFRRAWSPTIQQFPAELSDTSWRDVEEHSRTLQLLGAIDANGLTQVGTQMEPFVTDTRFPISPRLAKVVLQSAQMGCTRAAINAVSLLATDRPLHLCPSGDRSSAWWARKQLQKDEDRSDLPALLEADRRLQEVAQGGKDALEKFCQANHLGLLTWYRAHDIRKHLLRLAQRLRLPLEAQETKEEQLVEVFLYGFGDRLLRTEIDFDWGDEKWVWAIGHNGGPGLTFPSAIYDDARHRRGQLAFGLSLVLDGDVYEQFDTAALCTPEQVARVFGDRVTVSESGYNVRGGQVFCEQRWLFDGQSFLHRGVAAPGGEEAGKMLLLAMRDNKVKLPAEVMPIIDGVREASRLSGGSVPTLSDLQVIDLLAPHARNCASVAEVLATVKGVQLTWAQLAAATGCGDLEERVKAVRLQFPALAQFGDHELPVTYGDDLGISIGVAGVAVLPRLHEAALPSALATLATQGRVIRIVVTLDDGGELTCAFKDDELAKLRRQAACRKLMTDKLQQPFVDEVEGLLVEVTVDHGGSSEVVFVCRSHGQVFESRAEAIAQVVWMVEDHLITEGIDAAVQVCPVRSQPNREEVINIVQGVSKTFPDATLPTRELVWTAVVTVRTTCDARVRERLDEKVRLVERIRVLRARASLANNRDALGKLAATERQLGGTDGSPSAVPSVTTVVDAQTQLILVEVSLPEALPDDHPRTRLEVQVFELSQLAGQAWGPKKGEAKQAIGRLNALLRAERFDEGLALVPVIRGQVEAAVAASKKK